MYLGSIPHIYNIDKIKVYYHNKMIAEVWVGQHPLEWYIKEHEVLKECVDNEIEEMSVVIEGCISEVIALEIFIK